jgi:hypothetical protein
LPFWRRWLVLTNFASNCPRPWRFRVEPPHIVASLMGVSLGKNQQKYISYGTECCYFQRTFYS